MALLIGLLYLLGLLGLLTHAQVVSLNYGAFQGAVSGNVTAFLGMPFAAPP